MANPVVHWEIGAKDPKKIQDFYAALFGWKIDANNAYDYGMVDTEAGGINGGIGGTGAPDAPGRVSIYAQVDDLQACLNKAESLGGKTIMPPTEIPGAVTMAMYSDPEGNIMGLIKG